MRSADVSAFVRLQNEQNSTAMRTGRLSLNSSDSMSATSTPAVSPGQRGHKRDPSFNEPVSTLQLDDVLFDPKSPRTSVAVKENRLGQYKKSASFTLGSTKPADASPLVRMPTFTSSSFSALTEAANEESPADAILQAKLDQALEENAKAKKRVTQLEQQV